MIAPSEDTPPPAAPRRPSAGLVALKWIGAAVAAAALWSVFRDADLPAVAALVGAVGLPWMALGLLPNLAARVLQAEASRRVFQALGRPASFGRYLALTLSTEALLMSVPAGPAVSESATYYLLGRWCGVPGPQGVAGLAARRSLILLANAAYVAIALLLGFDALHRASRPLLGAPGLPWLVVLAGLFLLGASIAMSSALLSGSVAAKVLAALRRILGPRLGAGLDARAASFSATDRHAASLFGERRGALAAPALLLLGMWLAEGVETLVLLRLLRIDVSLGEVLSFEVVLALLRAAAFMVPAGLGVQDAGYVAFLAALGVPEAATAGAAFVVLKRAKEIVWIALGLLVFGWGRALGPRAHEAGAGPHAAPPARPCVGVGEP